MPREDRVEVTVEEVEHGDEQDRDGLGGVKEPLGGRIVPDGFWVAQVGVEDAHSGLFAQQVLGVGRRDRIVVDVDDRAVGVDLAGEVVDRASGWDARAEVEDLGDAAGDQVAYGPVQERPVGPGGGDRVRGG